MERETMFQRFSLEQSYRRAQSVRTLFIILVMFFALVGVIGVTVATRAAAATCPAQDMQYRVVQGDSLDTIAERFGTTYQVLAKESQIAIPRLIFPGQLVCIPPMHAKVVNMPMTGMNGVVPMPLLPNNQYVATARSAAMQAGLPSVQLFLNQINAESGFRAFDANGKPLVSGAGAIGIAQFEPGTAASLGINPTDPTQSLFGAARLMASYFMNRNGNIDMALSDYNAGPGATNAALAAAIKSGVGTSGFRSFLPLETQRYIHSITGN